MGRWKKLTGFRSRVRKSSRAELRRPAVEGLERRALLSGTEPTVSISPTSGDFQDDTAAIVFTVSLSAPSSVPVAVTYATADGAGPDAAAANQD
jgi:hypothetical protein